MIECLQEELVKVRLREAENDALIRELRSKIHELEEDKKTLRETAPDNSVAHLQEELIAVKLREAEANLSLKDLRQRVSELSAQWQRHLQVWKFLYVVIYHKLLIFYFMVYFIFLLNSLNWTATCWRLLLTEKKVNTMENLHYLCVCSCCKRLQMFFSETIIKDI